MTGLEPATPGVTGRYSNQLSYNRASRAGLDGAVARLTGLEPATPGVTGRYSNQLSYNRRLPPGSARTWQAFYGPYRPPSSGNGAKSGRALRVRTHSENMTMAARAQAERNTFGHLS